MVVNTTIFITEDIVVITFFGHAKNIYSENDEKRLYELIKKVADGKNIDFYLGGYGNFDILAKRSAKKYQEQHTNCKVVFVTPYLNKWLDDRKEYIDKEYDEIIYPELEQTLLKYAISKRNEWMIEQADYIIFYAQNHCGGTYSALLFAKKMGKPFANLYLD